MIHDAAPKAATAQQGRASRAWASRDSASRLSVPVSKTRTQTQASMSPCNAWQCSTGQGRNAYACLRAWTVTVDCGVRLQLRAQTGRCILQPLTMLLRMLLRMLACASAQSLRMHLRMCYLRMLSHMRDIGVYWYWFSNLCTRECIHKRVISSRACSCVHTR